MLDRLRRRAASETVPNDVWVVAGLGNPGPAYAGTRHSVGYQVVDELLARAGAAMRQHRSGRAVTADVRLGDPPGDRTVLMRAHGYMNESGGPIAALLRYTKVPPERLVVVYDELDIPYGDLRAKFGGGDNGHNGLKSIRQALGTGEYLRVRFGIGRPPGRQDPADFVLKPFSSAERRELELHVQRAADCVESLVHDGLGPTQNRYHV